jgi:PncC family amidohydrolase
VVEECAAILGDAVTSIDERRLEDEVALLLERAGATVATAESFTAGRIAASLSSPEGAAGFLRGGVVAYSTEMLTALAEVEEAVVADGDHSDAVLTAMATNVRRRAGADYGIAAVGVVDEADATPELPVGSAAWAIVGPDGAPVIERRFIPAADRDIIQTRGAAFVLEAFRRLLVARRDAREDVRPVAP